jgi:5-methylcytosine-specific restriction protein A
MPSKPLRPCKHPGCPNLVQLGYCEQHKQQERQYDRQRSSANKRGYTYRWQQYRLRYLARHPLCVECERQGIVEAATDVDHVIPHKGNQRLFWDESNWQSLCSYHHNIKTAKEDGGFGHLVK